MVSSIGDAYTRFRPVLQAVQNRRPEFRAFVLPDILTSVYKIKEADRVAPQSGRIDEKFL